MKASQRNGGIDVDSIKEENTLSYVYKHTSNHDKPEKSYPMSEKTRNVPRNTAK